MRRLFAIFSLLAIQASAADLAVLAPVLQDKQPLMKPAPQGGAAPVLKRVTQGALFQAIQAEARHGFTKTMLQLDDKAMHLAGKGKTTWLMLALEDGGFARVGFWLQEGSSLRYVDEAFVDLVVDQDSVADGSFEEIFAHELGHVFLRRLLPNLPNGYSRTPHHSYSVTDQQTAFDEGFATHFQALARRWTHNPRLIAQDQGIEYKAFIPLWQSNLDRALRIEGVRQNWFVHRQLTPDGAEAAYQRLDQSVLFDRARFKNPAQMLASEGFVATVFYRQLGVRPQASLAAGYEAMFRAFLDLNRQKLTPDSALMPSLAMSLLKSAPDAGQDLIKVMFETSYGGLGAPALLKQSEALAVAGRQGDGDAFVPALQTLRKTMAEQLAQVQADPARLASGVGPAIWLGQGEGEQALFVDANTAEREHLMALTGIDAAAAARAVAAREQAGPFRDAADFAARAGLAPATVMQLHQFALKTGLNARK